MNLNKAVLAGMLLVTSQAFAASTLEMCTAAGNVVRDALLVESLRVAFNESIDWHDAMLESFPKTWRELVIKDIEGFKPDVLTTVSAVLKEIPQWNQQGLNGQAMARKRIFSGLEKINEAYTIRCLKMLE